MQKNCIISYRVLTRKIIGRLKKCKESSNRKSGVTKRREDKTWVYTLNSANSKKKKKERENNNKKWAI